MRHPIPVNEAEGLIAPWYQSYSTEKNWSFSCDDGTGGTMQPRWDSLAILWKSGSAGKTVARFAKDYDLDLSRHDHLMLRCSLPDTCRLTLRAVIDGREQCVIDGVTGVNCYHEFAGPVAGARLTRIEISLVPLTDVEGMPTFLWLGCFDRARRDFMLSTPSPYDATWQDLLQDAPADIEPALNLFFAPGELAAIRHKITRDPYRGMFERLREQARRHLDSEPEKSIRPYLALSEYLGRRYDRDTEGTIPEKHRILPEAMCNCAFVGLIDNDPELCRMALRHALAAAHCTHWDDSFMETRPGSLWDHRAFTANCFAIPFIKAFDWAGALLGYHGRGLFCRTLSERVLPKVDLSLRAYAYMRECNQGLVFAHTGILSLCALAKVWPHGADGLDWYLEALRQSVESYILPDGGSYEGCAYFVWSCNVAMLGYDVAARHRNVPLADMLPACLRNTPAYFQAMASTSTLGGFINTSDGGRPGNRFSGETLPLLAKITGDARILRQFAGTCVPDAEGRYPASIAAIIHGPEELPAPEADLPVFVRMPDSAMISSFRKTPHGAVRLFFQGGKAGAGHTHDERGSFVLEAFGEEMLIDRGICFYGDSRSMLMQYVQRHNMLSPDDDDGSPIRPQNPCPEATIPDGTGDGRELHIMLDATAPYHEHLVGWTRHIDSAEPTELTLTDACERKTDGTVSLHFQSRSPWLRTPQGWVTEGTKARVHIEPQWQPVFAEGVEDLCDGVFVPVYRLTLRAERARRFDLRTGIRVEPVGGHGG